MPSLEDILRQAMENHSCVNCEPVNIGKLDDEETLLFKQIQTVECDVKRDIRHIKGKMAQGETLSYQLLNRLHDRLGIPHDVVPGVHRENFDVVISRKEAEQSKIPFTPIE